jgi:hypothetical protein
VRAANQQRETNAVDDQTVPQQPRPAWLTDDEIDVVPGTPLRSSRQFGAAR